ncbi:hypothetical protein [Microbacterium sp. NPDC056052]|uniref:hypothetical protein n=1 Tax=Microbacterium sp. NPDC056052 TaxID=3345695 RepID=UPI0035D6A0D2
MRGRARSHRGFIPGAVAGGVLALGWVVLSIAFGSGSAQAAEAVPPSPPSLLGAVQSTIVETPATVQSTLSAVQATVAEALPAPAAVDAPTPAPAAEAPTAPTPPLAPAAEEPAGPLVAPLVRAITPVLQDVGQTAGAAIDVVATTTDTVAPTLSPVLAPVDALLRRVPATLDTVTAVLPRIAVSLDDAVSAVTEAVRGPATTVAPPTTTAPGGHPAVPELRGLPDPVSAASPPAAPPSTQDHGQRALPGTDHAVDAVAISAPATVTAPGAPAQQPPGDPTSEFGMPGAGSASGGSASDVRLFGTVSSTSAGAGLLAVRSVSAGDDRLPTSPVADHDSSPD